MCRAATVSRSWAATPEGVFYGAQTAKQLVETGGPAGPVLHVATVRDWPAMRYRGLHDDLSPRTGADARLPEEADSDTGCVQSECVFALF